MAVLALPVARRAQMLVEMAATALQTQLQGHLSPMVVAVVEVALLAVRVGPVVGELE